jgi:formylglycine-generating enzyme required for sulfatase activity
LQVHHEHGHVGRADSADATRLAEVRRTNAAEFLLGLGHACRAGTSTPFWCGDTITPDDANFDADFPYHRADKHGDNRKRTTPVTMFRKNPFGLYDMHGNLAQWCEDWYGDYPDTDATDPHGPGTGEQRVLRGGSWDNTALSCRSAHRSAMKPTTRDYKVGFRVVYVPG